MTYQFFCTKLEIYNSKTSGLHIGIILPQANLTPALPVTKLSFLFTSSL